MLTVNSTIYRVAAASDDHACHFGKRIKGSVTNENYSQLSPTPPIPLRPSFLFLQRECNEVIAKPRPTFSVTTRRDNDELFAIPFIGHWRRLPVRYNDELYKILPRFSV